MYSPVDTQYLKRYAISAYVQLEATGKHARVHLQTGLMNKFTLGYVGVG